MSDRFRIAREIESTKEPWGNCRWVSHPPSTGSRFVTVVDALLRPGQGHSFHKHPGQEEVIYVVGGTLEQWVEQEKRLLGPGDAVFIPADMVHASFNASSADVRMIAMFGPSLGAEGQETIDVADQAPWRGLRA
jgi:quercetin dioxygenase-like cupin family protein